MVRAADAGLEEAEEPVDGLRVDIAFDVDLHIVVDRAVVVAAGAVEMVVAAELVGKEGLSA